MQLVPISNERSDRRVFDSDVDRPQLINKHQALKFRDKTPSQGSNYPPFYLFFPRDLNVNECFIKALGNAAFLSL